MDAEITVPQWGVLLDCAIQFSRVCNSSCKEATQKRKDTIECNHWYWN